MKRLNTIPKALRIVMPFVFFVAILGFMLISVDFVALNKGFYDRQFKRSNAAENAELSQSELNRVRDSLIAYFAGRSDTLQIEVTFEGVSEAEPFYTEDELSHMEDVKDVFFGFRVAGVIMFVTAITAIAVLCVIVNKRLLADLFSHGALIGALSFLGLFLIVGLSILMFFEPLFEFFHKVCFPQGNWQFPSDSNMLAILPETLFQTAGVLIAVSGIALAIALTAVSIVSKVFLKRREVAG